MLSEQDRDKLKHNFHNDYMAIRYNQFIGYISENPTGIVDITEYKIFQEMTLKRDMYGLAQGLLAGVFSFEEYFDKIQMIVGWDLMIQGIMAGSLKIKGNGEHNAIKEDLSDV